MTEQSADTSRSPLQRRHLLRGGAILAGTTGAAALWAASTAPARAADNEPTLLGNENSADSTTSIAIGADTGSEAPTLSLGNTAGPSLELQALDETWDAPLGVGQIANLTTGPLIGVDHGSGPSNTYIALGTDLQDLPIPYAFPPARVLDTRTRAGREGVVATSAGAFDSAFRLRGGHWLDVAIFASGDSFSIQGAYANLTVTSATGGGFATAYAPGNRPPTSSINYVKGQSIANGGFFEIGESQGVFALRIYVSGTTHVLLDVTGLTLVQQPGPTADDATRRRRGSRRTAVNARSVARRIGGR